MKRMLRRAKREIVGACAAATDWAHRTSIATAEIWRCCLHLAGDIYSGSTLRAMLIRVHNNWRGNWNGRY
jgi:hypothetical protein